MDSTGFRKKIGNAAVQIKREKWFCSQRHTLIRVLITCIIKASPAKSILKLMFKKLRPRIKNPTPQGPYSDRRHPNPSLQPHLPRVPRETSTSVMRTFPPSSSARARRRHRHLRPRLGPRASLLWWRTSRAEQRAGATRRTRRRTAVAPRAPLGERGRHPPRRRRAAAARPRGAHRSQIDSTV